MYRAERCTVQKDVTLQKMFIIKLKYTNRGKFWSIEEGPIRWHYRKDVIRWSLQVPFQKEHIYGGH